MNVACKYARLRGKEGTRILVSTNPIITQPKGNLHSKKNKTRSYKNMVTVNAPEYNITEN